MANTQNEEILRIKSVVLSYFPDCKFSDDPDDPDSLETVDKGEIFYMQKDILPYLQTMFFEEHLVEFQSNQLTRVFFAQMMDDLPDLFEEEDESGEVVIVEPEYEPGSYLKDFDNFLITPLTPAIGNAQVRSASNIVVRFFSGTIAIELGCTFREQVLVLEQPALRFNFPVVGRVNRNFRSYRVKIGQALDAKACYRSSKVSEVLYPIYDVSTGGIALVMSEDQPAFHEGQPLALVLLIQGMKELQVNGTVRNINKVRDKKGYIIICGIKIDLETRALAADLEQVTAMVQRQHLREISEKTDDLDGVSMVR